MRFAACCASDTPAGFWPVHVPRPQIDVAVDQPSSVIQIDLSPSPLATITSRTVRKPRNENRPIFPASRSNELGGSTRHAVSVWTATASNEPRPPRS